ncbi:uridine kinase [Gandjariella thermophila]|uniref:Uridine kinase n=1 Tax=Gandjariella thermophila TaxID=1931992 RepID=A0A4D4J4V4_9PSEU|nr:uridine kinase [Gandjariella thermophila]GDY30112.1 uridine kinase [Gandjariella thermophila]
MQVRPVSPERLVTELAERIDACGGAPWPRVAVDGPPAAEPAALADALVDPLRVRGRQVLRVSTWDFLRPASLRYEHGRTDPDARYEDWLDAGALRREVLAPLSPGGSGRALPSLWDARVDRASRAGYVELPEGGVLLLDGELLLGRGLPLDLTVHLWLSPGALARRTPAEEHWALPAYRRYDDEVSPQRVADVVVRVDDPRRPAVVDRLHSAG